jgi:tyramine---L-glutamate ligase
MTTVFVYEDVCATEAGRDDQSRPASSLLAEARAMLAAVTADFRAVGVRVAEPGADFASQVRSADYTLVIAPECAGRLEQLCEEVLSNGGQLLGPTPDAVRLTADKLGLARHWNRLGIATPETWELGEQPGGIPVVIKPRDGAGSQATILKMVDGQQTSVASDSWTGPLIAQRYIAGFAASVAFLIGPKIRAPLIPCEQLLSDDGQFHYRGGQLPIAPHLADRALRIATAAVVCVPGLRGYVGVDVVLGDDGRDWAIEINPRLTTSYVGLRALARFNLASAMLAAVRGEPLPALEWRREEISFTPDGRVSTLPIRDVTAST